MLNLLLLTVFTLATPSGDLEQSLAILEATHDTPISVDLAGQPVARVIDEIAEQCPHPVRADWEALDLIGVRPRDEVNAQYDGVPALAALEAIALQLGDEFERPTFEAFAGGLILTTASGARERNFTAAYDVRDLVAQGIEDALAETVERTIDEEEGDAAEPPADRDEPMAAAGERLLLMILEHVHPESWFAFGGDAAKATEHAGVLMVTATATTHRRIAEALALLRETNPFVRRLTAAVIELDTAEWSRLQGLEVSAILADEAVTLAWQTTADVRLGAEISATVGGTTLSVTPQRDPLVGVLDLEIHFRTADGTREVRTTTSMTGPGGTLVAVPGGGDRLTVLAIR